MGFRLVNRSGYDDGDLRRFIAAGLRACRYREAGLVVHVVSAPGRSKGCAAIGGKRMTLAVAPPSRCRIRRLALVFVHEVQHLKGDRHEDMTERMRYSLGDTPAWARGLRLRYRGRARPQLVDLRPERLTRR